jgi:hypothetical protein
MSIPRPAPDEALIIAPDGRVMIVSRVELQRLTQGKYSEQRRADRLDAGFCGELRRGDRASLTTAQCGKRRLTDVVREYRSARSVGGMGGLYNFCQ